jgi:hypothetical protein
MYSPGSNKKGFFFYKTTPVDGLQSALISGFMREGQLNNDNATAARDIALHHPTVR